MTGFTNDSELSGKWSLKSFSPGKIEHKYKFLYDYYTKFGNIDHMGK